jgi:hypothetical protein
MQATEFVEGLQHPPIVPRDLQYHSKKIPSLEMVIERERTADPAFRLIVNLVVSRSVDPIGWQLTIRFVEGCSQGDEVGFGKEL